MSGSQWAGAAIVGSVFGGLIIAQGLTQGWLVTIASWVIALIITAVLIVGIRMLAD